MKKRIMGNNALKYGAIGIATTIVSRAINLISVPIFSRLLSRSEYGSVDVFFSLSNILYIIIGLSAFGIVERAILDYKDDSKKYIATTMNLIVLNSIVIIVFANIIYSDVRNLLAISRYSLNLMLIYSLMLCIISYKNCELNYRFKYVYNMWYTMACILPNLFLSVCFILINIFPSNYFARIYGAIIPSIFLGIWTYVTYQKDTKDRFDLEYVKYTLKYALPLIPHNLSVLLLSNADRIMINKLFGASVAAIYALTYTVGILMSVAVEGVNKIYLPVLFRKMETETYKDVSAYQTLLILGMSIILVAVQMVSPELILIMGGESYIECQTFVNWIIYSTFVYFLYTLYYNLEYYNKRTILIAIGTIISVVINILLNYYFMPIYGYKFGVFSTVISYIVLLAIHMIFVRNYINNRIGSDLLIIVAVIIMAIITYLFQKIYLYLWLRYVVGILACLIGCISLFTLGNKYRKNGIRFKL